MGVKLYMTRHDGLSWKGSVNQTLEEQRRPRSDVYYSIALGVLRVLFGWNEAMARLCHAYDLTLGVLES